LGPGTIVVDGRQTTVDAELKDVASALEESKADVMGVWNLLFMMDKGEIPAAEKSQLFATYFTGIFRAMRSGTESAHGHGAALQYGYLKDKRAFAWDSGAARFVIDEANMEAGLRALLREQLMLQATGDYEGAKALCARWARLDENARGAMAAMDGIPVDIRPIYPDRI